VLSAIVTLLAIGCHLAPVVGAWYCHKEQEADESRVGIAENEEAQEPNPLAGVNVDAM